MNTSLFGGAMFIGILTACWAKVKALLSRLWSIAFVNVRLSGNLVIAVKSHCWRNFRRSPFGSRQYASDMIWVRPVKRLQHIGYETMSNDPILFWNGWRPMLVGDGGGSGNNPGNGDPFSNNSNGNSQSLSVSFVRGTFDLDGFLTQCLQEFNEKFEPAIRDTLKTPSRFFIRRYMGSGAGGQRRVSNGNPGSLAAKKPSDSMLSSGNITLAVETGEIRLLKWTNSDVGPEITPNQKALDALALPESVRSIINELKQWLDSEEWYREKMIPWTRGWLLYGRAGSGKTSLVRGIAQDFDLPVFVFDLPSMSNEEFMNFWEDMKCHSPCIALFEDFDAVFNGRKNVTGEMGGGLTFDCVLNALSGIENANGIFKVITTNNIAALDEAIGVPREKSDGKMISTRPGRCDRAFELPDLDEACRRKLAERILADCPQYITGIVAEGEGDTGSQFQERCAQIALLERWKEKEAAALADLHLVAEVEVHAEAA